MLSRKKQKAHKMRFKIGTTLNPEIAINQPQAHSSGTQCSVPARDSRRKQLRKNCAKRKSIPIRKTLINNVLIRKTRKQKFSQKSAQKRKFATFSSQFKTNNPHNLSATIVPRILLAYPAANQRQYF
jgi:hypothetical protein